MSNTKSDANELMGRLVAVHPNLTTDPANMQGQIGSIIGAEEHSVTVAFPGKVKAGYTYDALLVLAPFATILKHINNAFYKLQPEDRRILLKAMELQADGREAQALSLVLTLPGSLLHCTRYLLEVKLEQKQQLKNKGRRRL